MSENPSTDAGRAAESAQPPLNRTLPEGVAPYSVSPVFTPETLPDALKSVHTIKAGTWGLLKVQSGVLRYVQDGEPHFEAALTAGQQVVIAPQMPHHVAFESPGAFQITFCRAPD